MEHYNLFGELEHGRARPLAHNKSSKLEIRARLLAKLLKRRQKIFMCAIVLSPAGFNAQCNYLILRHTSSQRKTRTNSIWNESKLYYHDQCVIDTHYQAVFFFFFFGSKIKYWIRKFGNFPLNLTGNIGFEIRST